ncbi:MAG: hypothetical protein DRQ88_11105 [Epsilonproteobacteria bacterium]|nr:MAG: hypothetical protein DRQ89_05975 [Campylobacterota bacterium]RLA64293.1 MAG: hypothetical protein DRQ88_11105 [Campylobacterota bacterium]
MVHCGFYDKGIYESHVNFFVVALDFKAAKAKAKELPEYIDKKMHVDGIEEVTAVDGFYLNLVEDEALDGASIIKGHR